MVGVVLTGGPRVLLRRLWRRSGGEDDLEFYELRYSGKAPPSVRGFRAVYLGCSSHCFIMGDGDPGRVQDRHISLRPAAVADDHRLCAS